MIKIPGDRRIILTTLDFAQITDRLETAIYDPDFSSRSSDNPTPKHQQYFGKIQGLRFIATRIVGHKYLHVPAFLVPTIEGKIESLYRGYEISLTLKLNEITFAVLLAWLGVMLTTISSVLDNMFADSKNYQYLTIVLILAGLYILVVAYFYFEGWRARRFFKQLFTNGFAGATHARDVDSAMWQPEFDFEEVGNLRSTATLLRQNLPSFPARQSAAPQAGARQSITTLLHQNLPSFPRRESNLDREAHRQTDLTE
ncbi:hypothetical protein [Chamaesiphon sp. VAR_48_metabat_403]|uniref:hypothetical protein n=1 Tax=Chamaesiphon sp. VAR_48_metabat_403 TaxID=2964700 RepID=UPI00286DC797|nr:hypothetical protein [Chamaesiphon sp. VAR_48_metabat_403]